MLAYYGSKMDITRMDISVVVIGLLSFFVLLGAVFAQCSCSDGDDDDDSNSDTDISFDRNYYVQWGNDHVWPINQGKEIQLSLDLASGCRFGSKQYYSSGFFHTRLKIPGRDSAGVVTAFYLMSEDNGGHDELDFEFLGNTEGKPISLQTNIFINGVGGREQKIHLWFDPTAHFHTYKILWNPSQIVFYVEDIPIRVFRNNRNAGIGYPSHPMQIQASLWDGSDWATDGGRTKINWAYAPFRAYLQKFDISGCPSQTSNINQECYSSNYWWNTNKYRRLNSTQQRQYENVRRNYMHYDYCSDRSKYPIPPRECLYVVIMPTKFFISSHVPKFALKGK